MKYCEQCGTKVVGEPKFCENCGHSLRGADTAPAGVSESVSVETSTAIPAETAVVSTKKRAFVVGAIAVVLVAGLSVAGWRLYEQSQPEAQARRDALRTVKAVGEALVAGDVAAFDKQVLSKRDIALLTIAETSPALMSESDDTLIDAFDTTMSQNRLFANIGEALVRMREGDTVWFYSIDHSRVCFLTNSGVEDKKRVFVLARAGEEWRLAYWTPPMTSSQWETFLRAAAPPEDPMTPVPDVQAVLSAAGMSYDRGATVEKAKEVAVPDVLAAINGHEFTDYSEEELRGFVDEYLATYTLNGEVRLQSIAQEDSQEPAAGTMVPEGTTVVVNFGIGG